MTTQKQKLGELRELAKLIRYWSLMMSTAASSGHPSSSLSAVELMTVLMFDGVLKFDVDNPDAPTNDRLIFSKGHASPLYYALWAAAGQIEPEHLKTFRDFDSDLEGHPTRRFKFTEVATGSLGQGLSIGLGMALAAKYLDKTNARIYVLLGDSEMAEGSVWEALGVAAYYKCDNLIGIIDVNRLGQRGETMLGHDVETYRKRAESFGWNAVVVDGHNSEEIYTAFDGVRAYCNTPQQDKPTMIIAKTLKGKGVSFIENKDGWHGKVLSQEEFDLAKQELGNIDFDLRGEIAPPIVSDQELENRNQKIQNPKKLQATSYKLKAEIATREAYGAGLVDVMAENDRVVVFDAETSNSTHAAKVKEPYPERFFEMFIAEQNMIGVGIGFARRGYVPYMSSFAAFLIRGADQIRMAQYSQANINIVGSHAGVSIGEDGASQMALEDIALFRTILTSTVLYPSDAMSTRKLVCAMAQREGVVYMRTTRAKTPMLYGVQEEFPIGGSKTLRTSADDRLTIVSAGITLHEALKAYDILKESGVVVRVIDLYSVKPIDRDALVGAAQEAEHVLTVEDHYAEGGLGEAVQSALGKHAGKVTMLAVTKMPRSGTPQELLAYEGIDAAGIVAKVKEILG